MANILLVNFHDDQRDRLASFLRGAHHDVCAAAGDERLLEMLKQCAAQVDLMILDISHREKYVRELLKEVVAHRARNGPRPMVLCISRVYRGPCFELELERKGARVVYVQ